MGIEYRVALSGFSAFERAALASYFRLVATRASHHYIQTADTAQAEFIVVDADQPELVVAVLSAARVADTVFVGAHAPPTAMAQLQRPIDPRHVVLELDALVAQRGAPASPASAAPAATEAASVTDAATSQRTPPPHSAQPTSAGGLQLLLVGPASPARQRLAERLKALGVPVQTAHRSDQALEQLALHHCSAVFIDATPQDSGSIGGGDLDGLLLCQDIKRSCRQGENARELPVVLVATRGGAADRVRGHLAGCDAYLIEPIGEAALLQVLHELSVLPDAPTPGQLRQRQRSKPRSAGHGPTERG